MTMWGWLLCTGTLADDLIARARALPEFEVIARHTPNCRSLEEARVWQRAVAERFAAR
jgi:hypothetical protein